MKFPLRGRMRAYTLMAIGIAAWIGGVVVGVAAVRTRQEWLMGPFLALIGVIVGGGPLTRGDHLRKCGKCQYEWMMLRGYVPYRPSAHCRQIMPFAL